jgi:hypothetical protein
MKFLSDKNHILWLLMLIAVVVVIVIYRIGLSGTGSNEKAITSDENSPQQKAETKSNSAETDSSANPSESESQFSNSTDLRQELPKESRYRSKNPLYFRVVFGKEGNNPMLGVVDESAGTGTGYDVAYIDENMNGDLTDEAAKKFSRYERGSRAGQLEPRFEFIGPFKGEQKAKYTLYIYSLTRKTYSRLPGNDYYFHWFLDINQWHYFFINGKMALFSNVADAMKGKPVHLGSECMWQINRGTQDGRAMVSAGVKDGNGCTLRSLRRAGERLSPTLTLIQDDKVIREEKMKFG